LDCSIIIRPPIFFCYHRLLQGNTLTDQMIAITMQNMPPEVSILAPAQDDMVYYANGSLKKVDLKFIAEDDEESSLECHYYVYRAGATVGSRKIDANSGEEVAVKLTVQSPPEVGRFYYYTIEVTCYDGNSETLNPQFRTFYIEREGTILAPPPEGSECGNMVVEEGEQCDGTAGLVPGCICDETCRLVCETTDTGSGSVGGGDEDSSDGGIAPLLTQPITEATESNWLHSALSMERRLPITSRTLPELCVSSTRILPMRSVIVLVKVADMPGSSSS